MKKRIEEWIARAEHDLEAAQLLLDHKAHADIVLFHAHQAVEKYLKAFLLHHGWKLRKIHDLETLITDAMDVESAFETYLDLGRRLTAFYYTERYPPGPVPSYAFEETRRLLKQTEALIRRIKSQL
jgi:HEPN domain-containing protein